MVFPIPGLFFFADGHTGHQNLVIILLSLLVADGSSAVRRAPRVPVGPEYEVRQSLPEKNGEKEPSGINMPTPVG